MIARKQLGAIRFGPGERLLQSYTAGLTWQQRYSAAGAFQQARAALSPAVRAAAFEAYVADPIDRAPANAIVDAQIGRASARERGWQYVEVPGGAVCLKKKRNEN